MGQLVRVYRLMRDAQGEHIFCQLRDETICCLPAWMFSPECTKFTFGAPMVSAAALTELRDLLATLRAAAPCDKSSQEVPKEGNA